MISRTLTKIPNTIILHICIILFYNCTLVISRTACIITLHCRAFPYCFSRYETYTMDANNHGDRYTDYTGYSVTSDKPISVSAGHGYVLVTRIILLYM